MRNNIITAVAGDNLYIRTESAFQYDYGLKLVIAGVELPQFYDVHFGNSHGDAAKTVTGDSTGVDIPDEYLLNGEDIHAYVYLHTGNDDEDGETVYHIHIPVADRAAIGKEQITPVEHNFIDEALEYIAGATAKIPDPPDEDGTYVLTLERSGNDITYSWVASGTSDDNNQ